MLCSMLLFTPSKYYNCWVYNIKWKKIIFLKIFLLYLFAFKKKMHKKKHKPKQGIRSEWNFVFLRDKNKISCTIHSSSFQTTSNSNKNQIENICICFSFIYLFIYICFSMQRLLYFTRFAFLCFYSI